MKSIKMKLQILHQIKEKNAFEGNVEDYQKKVFLAMLFIPGDHLRPRRFSGGEGSKIGQIC